MGSQFNSTFTQSIYSNTAGTQSYVLNARDNTELLTFSHSATSSVRFVHPFFHSFSSTNINLYGGSAVTRASQLGTVINASTRLVIPYLGPSQSILVPYNGSGHIYFLVPFVYPLLSRIKDANGFIIHDSSLLNISAFTFSGSVTPNGGIDIATPTPAWRIYRTIGTCSYSGSGNFEFIF